MLLVFARPQPLTANGGLWDWRNRSSTIHNEIALFLFTVEELLKIGKRKKYASLLRSAKHGTDQIRETQRSVKRSA